MRALAPEVVDIIGQSIEPLLPPPERTHRVRREAHARMLGNGLCTRPVELDCRLETACETCSYFTTSPEFVPVLLRQRDHARDHNQPDRAALYDNLITPANKDPS